MLEFLKTKEIYKQAQPFKEELKRKLDSEINKKSLSK